MSRRNGSSDGPVVVTGPDEPGRNVPNHGAGVAYAMHRAALSDSDRTWYVRSDGVVTTVVRQPDGVVTCETLAAGRDTVAGSGVEQSGSSSRS